MTEAAAAAAAAQAAEAGEGSPAAESTPWTESINEDNRGLVEVKGWESMDAVFDSYRNLEKLMGAGPDKLMKMPDAGDADGMSALYGKLGRPDNATGYELGIPDDVNIDQDFLKGFTEAAHNLNVTNEQAKGLVGFWNEYVVGALQAENEEKNLQSQSELTELKKEWGNGYNAEVAKGQAAAREFGVDEETLSQMEDAMGTAKLMKLFADIGNRLGEDNFEQGDVLHNSFGMTPAAAKEKINELRLDKDFMKVYLDGSAPGHKEAVQRMTTLTQQAYPESQAA